MFQATGTKEQSTEVQPVPCKINDALAQTILVEKARTLQDLVREMLQPMLKSWLDNNLPAVVERLVLAEIEKIVGSKAHAERREP